MFEMTDQLLRKEHRSILSRNPLNLGVRLVPGFEKARVFKRPLKSFGFPEDYLYEAGENGLSLSS